MGPSLGCREELEKMHSCESVVHISSAGPTAIKGLSNDDVKETDSHWSHRAVQRLAEFFHDDNDKHAITVCTMFPLSVPASLSSN
jgi:hypothetical protein